jgi:hypothetical protein
VSEFQLRRSTNQRQNKLFSPTVDGKDAFGMVTAPKAGNSKVLSVSTAGHEML